MPLKLHPPREGKTPNYYIRGTYLGIRVDRTTGVSDRAKARKVLEQVKADIERGRLAPRLGPTFADAALSYVRAGGEDLYIGPLNDRLGDTPLADIDQATIDAVAHEFYPSASPATRNRQVYTPVSAVLKHANVDFKLRRPKGAQGQIKTDWMWEEDAFRLLDEAEAIDPELRVFLAILLYTGLRLSEAIWLKTDAVRLAESYAFIPDPLKNDDPRALHLPPALVAELANHPRGLDRPGETVCRFRKNGHLYGLFKKAKIAAKLPKVTFHTFRHTWATWMRRYAKLDSKGLVATRAWRDEKSAARYSHTVISEEAQRADLLPAPKRGKSVENGKS